MKNRSPRDIALITAIVNVILIIFIYFVGSLIIAAPFNWPLIILILPFSFLTTYLVFYFSIDVFINQKIKLIYKTIHKEKRGSQKDEKINLAEDVFGNVSRQVIEWAKENRDEIQELKKQEAFRREFIGNLSHELKTPVFNIQGYLLTLIEGGLEDDRINRDYLEKADKNLDRILTLIKDLDMISRLESGNNLLNKKKFDLSALIQDVIGSLELKAKGKQIQLTTNFNTDKTNYVLADRDKIYQVLSNLIINSINYGKKGGVTTVRIHDMGENKLIEVADNGLGIGKEHLPRLFERFYRVDKSRARNQGGSGLGLAIVKHIIEGHGQTINVRSTENEGSTFAFTLAKAK